MNPVMTLFTQSTVSRVVTEDVLWRTRWLFDKRTQTHTSKGVGFYRDQLDLLRVDQLSDSLLILCWDLCLLSNEFWDLYPATAYAALPKHSGILTGTWRSAVLLICFNIVEVHLLKHILRRYGMVQGIPQECNTNAHLHRSNIMGLVPKNWNDINALHIALWDQRQEYLRQSILIDKANGVSRRLIIYPSSYRSLVVGWLHDMLFLQPSTHPLHQWWLHS